MQPRIAIIVDHPDRDLAGLVLTARELCYHGAACYLVPMNLAEREIWALAPHFVLLNFIRVVNQDLVRHMAEAGIAFGVLDTEGGVWSSPESYAELLLPVRNELRLAECNCAWGPRMAEYLVSEGLYSRAQAVVTGCPRFDLYSPAWRSMVCNGNRRDRQSRVILVNTNFTTVNSRFATTAQNFDLQVKLGVPRSTVEAMVNAEEQAIRLTIDMAKQLAADFPGARVVVRPHPFERPEPYIRELASLGNAEVNSSGPVQPQIMRAAVVIQRSCSTAIEAGLAGAPALSPQWIPPYILIPVAESVSVACKTYSELRSCVQSALTDSFAPPVSVRETLQKVISEWFYAADGNAHTRVASTVLNCLGHRGKVDHALCRKFLYGIGARGASGRAGAGNRVRRLFGLGPDWSFRHLRRVPDKAWRRTAKAYGIREVSELASAADSAASAAGSFPAARLRATLARESGDYIEHFAGHSVRLTA
ncbi:MAG TPA: surface carbohydrate biosynthesis protein [Bryobacteraceae bacterium]|nr:surface carbohydrate biosynthesis protein [Bryobacteraceae bacterium]